MVLNQAVLKTEFNKQISMRRPTDFIKLKSSFESKIAYDNGCYQKLLTKEDWREIDVRMPRVYMALQREKADPKVDYPPLRIFHFSNETFTAGVESHSIDGIEIKVFSPEKTVADCFKYRNKIGLEVAIKGLKNCLQRRGSRSKILDYVKLCRIEKIIRPYLEAID